MPSSAGPLLFRWQNPAKHHRLQRQTAFVEYAFQVTLCRASSLPAGKFCGGSRAKMNGGFALLTQYDQLFHEQKADKSGTETLKTFRVDNG